MALGDVVSVETLAFVVALERAKDRGVDYELTSFAKEELAIQAIVNGQADLGVGTPYSVIQKTKVPLKIVYQMSRLIFFPVASIEYKTWKDSTASRSPSMPAAPAPKPSATSSPSAKGSPSATELCAGFENRIIAMMNGQIKATVVDLANKNVLMAKAGDRFHAARRREPGERRAGVRQ